MDSTCLYQHHEATYGDHSVNQIHPSGRQVTFRTTEILCEDVW